MRTLKDLAAEALAVQDASNIFGITNSYAKALWDLKKALEAENKPCGSDDINVHPINHLWVSKIADLSCFEAYSIAVSEAAVQQMANAE